MWVWALRFMVGVWGLGVLGVWVWGVGFRDLYLIVGGLPAKSLPIRALRSCLGVP